MSKIITILGATGTQGGSVVRAFLDDPEYSIRAITRNPDGDAAKALADRGVEVVKADTNDVASLRAAFAGSHAVFAVTNYFEAVPVHGVDKSMDIETSQGVNIADAAAATESLVHYVWSTLPNSRKNSGGKVVIPYYESKNRVDDYIRAKPELLAKTTFLWIGWYASNLMFPWNKPFEFPTEDGSKLHVQMLSVTPSVKFPLAGDEKTNTGLFVKAILARPDQALPGRTAAVLEKNQAYDDLSRVYAEAQGIKTRCVQIPQSDFLRLWPFFGGLMDTTYRYLDLVDGKGFVNGDEHILTGEDLGVEGFVTAAEAYGAVRLYG